MKVTLPLTFPGIFSAIILTFIPALGTYVITDMLGGGKVLYIGNIIKNQFGTIRNWPLGAAMSVLLLAVTALMIFIYSKHKEIIRLFKDFWFQFIPAKERGENPEPVVYGTIDAKAEAEQLA